MIVCHTMCAMKGNPRLLPPSREHSFESHGGFCSAKRPSDPSSFLHHQKLPVSHLPGRQRGNINGAKRKAACNEPGEGPGTLGGHQGGGDRTARGHFDIMGRTRPTVGVMELWDGVVSVYARHRSRVSDAGIVHLLTVWPGPPFMVAACGLQEPRESLEPGSGHDLQLRPDFPN